jgi:hypothetical protein
MNNLCKVHRLTMAVTLIAFTFSASAQVSATDSTKQATIDSTRRLMAQTIKQEIIGYFEQPAIQFFRPNDKRGLEMFETTKDDSVPFTKLKVRIGGNFTADVQALTDQNNATPVLVNGVNTNQLIRIKPGFTNPMANLNVDAQLYDGIRLEMTIYLSTRHHQDTWVKGGYIQIDKLKFLKSRLVDLMMKNFTIKVGDYDVDYGDQHFRRTDGGNAIYNPFVENYIMDEFATELGGELYYHHPSGVFGMFGVTNGELDPTIVAATLIDSSTGKVNRYDAAFHGKLGYDKQLTKNFRMRVSGSFYTVKSTPSNTLFFGDRTGSHYFLVMENTAADAVDNAWSGRYNPLYTEQVRTFMGNIFLKFHGLEFFGTGEFAEGRMITERNLRQTTQFAGDLIYRFTKKENFWVAARFNTVRAAMPGDPNYVTINRVVGSVGWFVIKHVVLKVEYVYQQYRNFAPTDIDAGGSFKGAMIEASIGF